MNLPANATLHYRTRFSLRPTTDSPIDWGDVVRKVRFWIGKRVERNDAYNRGSWFYTGGQWAPPGGQGTLVETRRFIGSGTDDAPQFWALCLTHPCGQFPQSRRWQTNIGIAFQDDGSLEFAISNHHWIIPGFIGEEPEPPPSSAPSIVRHLIDDSRHFACLGTTKLSASPHRLDVGDGAALRDELADAHRQCPIVVIRTSRTTERPVLNPVELAKLLAGIALVYDAPARELNEELEWMIPEAYRCTHGMARVYMPGLRLNASHDYRRHRFFLDRNVDSLGQDVIRDLVVEALARRFTASAQHSVGSISDVEQLKRRSEIERVIQQARESVQDTEFVDFCNNEVKRLEADVERLQLEIEEANERADQAKTTIRTEEFLRRNAEQRTASAEAEASRLRDVLKLIADHGLPVESLCEAMEVIETLFPDRVVFTAEARRSAERAEFNSLRRELPQVVRLLWHLATTMHELLYRDGTESGRIVDLFRERSGGFEMAMTEGSMTNRDASASAARRVDFNGETVDITPHLKLGPVQNKWLRVYFGKATNLHGQQILVVGHCGDHLDTAGTRRRRG